MDGNRRWAKKRGVSTAEGHAAGAENLTRIVEEAAKIGIRVVTAYSFSTENWNRPSDEVASLWELFELYLTSRCDEMVKNGVHLEIIGDSKNIPQSALSTFNDVKKATSKCNKIDLVLAINYGSRNEMCRAMLKLIKNYEDGIIKKEDITEKVFSRYLDTAQWSDPELLIRTSGEMRVSNFLLWQLSYAEMYVSDILWPDFDEKCLREAIEVYQHRQRRYGE